MKDNQPSLNREMFYDRLVKGFSSFCNYARDNKIDARPIEEELTILRDSTKIFYIDSMTLDSLLNQPYSLKDFTPDVIHLPYPHMFFEFERGLKHKNLEGEAEEDNFWINGLLYSKLPRSPIIDFMKRRQSGDLTQNGFSVSSFGNYFNAQSGGPFDTLTYFEESRKFIIEKRRSNAKNCKVYQFDLDKQEITKLLLNNDDNVILSPLNLKQSEGDYIDSLKMANLAVNLVDYINAENIIITPKNRILRGGGKRPHKQLKPFNLIEVKRSVYPKREDSQEGLWELDCRFWVMGHNHKYHTKNGIITNWVEPYIKGPENAPWKNSRYLMLYKNFRSRLDRRGNEELGTSLED